MYCLMNKDEKVAEIVVGKGILGHTYALSDARKDRLPIGFCHVEEWLENRKASKHNRRMKAIMQLCDCENMEGFLRATHGASLNDTFWLKSDEENVKWEDVSLYRNSFDGSISRLAFGRSDLYDARLSNASPEMTTSGSFKKCWMRGRNGDICLYKRGREGVRAVELEAYSEVMASELASLICPGAVEYKLVKLQGEIASKCRLFTDEACGYVPIAGYADVQHESPDRLLEFFAGIGSEDAFRRMIVLDSIIFNVDRHGGNYGVLIDNDTLKPIKMAPVFDLNLALLPYAEQEAFEDIGTKMMGYGPGIGSDFTRMGQMVMTSEIRSTLIGLEGFRFSFRGDENYPEWRVNMMEELVNRQIEALLDKNVLYTKDVFVPKQLLIQGE